MIILGWPELFQLPRKRQRLPTLGCHDRVVLRPRFPPILSPFLAITLKESSVSGKIVLIGGFAGLIYRESGTSLCSE